MPGTPITIGAVVLMARIDPDYKCIFIEVGSFGSSADSAIFQNTAMGSLLQQNKLHIPPARHI
nr:unnamed protein product [Callosobruchus analis]